ncbi:ribosome recycling factor [bacterium]|nr:ribosome recycling factor [candidate division CSSED10-310 bacterium]
MIDEVYTDAEIRMQETVEHYKRQFSTVRTGRASSGLVENMRIDYYGTSTPLKQMAKIAIPEPSLIVIQPWDSSALPAIERAIQTSDLGMMPNNDGKIIRLNVPVLTEERRIQLAKLVKKMTEEGRVAIRNIRRDANETIKEFLKEKDISEDDAHAGYDRIQNLTNDFIVKIDQLGERKEKELMEL